MPSDAAFREALEDFGQAYADYDDGGDGADLDAARARVLALYAQAESERGTWVRLAEANAERARLGDEMLDALRAERQGEVYEATMRMGYNGHEPAFFYPVFDKIVPLKPGDRVRVSRVEGK